MSHVRGTPYHPMTQGKIERWHQTLKNQCLLEHYYLPEIVDADRAARIRQQHVLTIGLKVMSLQVPAPFCWQPKATRTLAERFDRSSSLR